jgi:hypothetical protein
MLYYPKNQRLTRDGIDQVLSWTGISVALIAFIGVVSWAIIVGLIAIKTWEKANNYPFGFMCKSVFTGYVDTCPKDLHERVGVKYQHRMETLPVIRKVY